ncbi:MAG: DUF2849 domain-containing protein [Proteobacteria bacterium]|nr:DUF2849 domain-containing protein [Pseudomonadota bacterium]
MAATPSTQAITANRLRDGDVVYWRDGTWAEALSEAQVFETKSGADAALKAAEKFVAARFVVNPYLFPVRVENGRVRPTEEREIVRSEGPSVRRDLGKQAATARSANSHV